MSLKVYKASAGSGKTFQLALEYISLALSNESPYTFSHILAVTFTNKATAEMKERILAQLYNLAHGQKDQTFYLEIQKLLPHLDRQEIEHRAAETLKAIVHDYDHFRVETIDSFFQSLLTNLAHELNLSRTFRVNLDAEEVISRAVDHLLTSLRTSQNTNVTRLILDYMEEQIDDNKGWDISRGLKSFAEGNLFNEKYLTHENQLNQELNNPKKISEFKNSLYNTRKKISEPLRERAMQLLEKLSPATSSVDPQNLKSYKGLKDFALSVLADNYSDEVKTTIDKASSDWKALLKKDLQKDPDYQVLAQNISADLEFIVNNRHSAAPFMTTSDLILDKLTPLLLLNTIGREVSNLNRETGSFLLAKTADLFNKMVEKEDASFVFERSGITFNHIMIDEFQDTSGSQWENFKTLLIENLSQGDECMLVGDIKQSIYRWRGGNWRILGNIENEMKNQGKVEVKNLTKNYRSQREVIHFNNSLFEFIADYFNKENNQTLDTKDKREKDDDAKQANEIFPYIDSDKENTISHIYQDVTQSVKDSADKGYVRVDMISKDATDEDVLEDLCKQIIFLHEEKHIPYDKMGILVRRNSETVKIIQYISEHYLQLPITSDEAFKLSASPSVMLLVNTLKVLSSDKDSVAAELTRQLTETIYQISSQEPHGTIEELTDQKEKLIHMPLFELCYWLIDFYQLPLTESHSAGQSAYLYSFIDQVRAFVDENSSDIHKFIEYWDESLHKKAIAVDIKDSIYVMTIHKSKGLEYHTILIPFCDWVLDKDFANDIIWCDTTRLTDEFNKISLVPVATYSSKKVKASAFKGPYEYEHLEQYIDGINELYVALTRAEHNLLIWSKESKFKNQINSILKAYLKTIPTSTYNKEEETSTESENEDIHTFGTPSEYVVKESKTNNNPLEMSNATQQDLYLSATSAQTEFRQSNKAQDYIMSLHDSQSDDTSEEQEEQSQTQKNQRYYIDRGKLLHQLFSMIRTSDDIENAITRLVQEGVIQDNEEQSKLKKFIQKRISNPKVAHWFDGSWNLFTECNILMRGKDNKVIQYRPDRVMKKDDTTIVIDYKFGNFDSSYIDQVQRYMNALKQMGYPNIQGYLWFVYKDTIEEVTL